MFEVHEGWQGTGPELVLDTTLLEFPNIAQSLALMRTTVLQGGDTGLAGLSFGEKRERERLLEEKRIAAAYEMIRVSARLQSSWGTATYNHG